MKALSPLARMLYGPAVVGFAAPSLIYAIHRLWPLPGPPWTAGSTALAWLLPIALFAAGACLVTGRIVQLAAAALSVLFVARFFMIHLPRIGTHLHTPQPWTAGFEILAIGGGALAPAASASGRSVSGTAGTFVTIGSFFLGARLVVGVQHFLYSQFVSTLVPAWISHRLLFAYLVGVGFFTTAISIFARVLTRLATTVQGIVFAFFATIVHTPRLLAAPHFGDGWTSLFIALGMAGTCFAIARALPRQRGLTLKPRATASAK